MTPRLIDPAAIGELREILALDGLFTVVVVGALIAMDALGALPLRDAMTMKPNNPLPNSTEGFRALISPKIGL